MKALIMLTVLILTSNAAKSGEINVYNFSKECGLYFESTRVFLDTEDSRCNKLGKEIPVFFNFVRSDKNGEEIYTRESFDDNDYSQSIIKKTKIDSLRKDIRDQIIVTLIKAEKIIYACDTNRESTTCQSDLRGDKPDHGKLVTEFYECWDGLFYGKNKHAVVSAGLCSFHKPKSPFASLNSWQAKLIKSLVITVDGDVSYPSPSFDCAEASSSIEKTICADARLSLLDATLDSNYKRLKSANLGDKSGQLLSDQRAWIKQRNACETPECLNEIYTRRIDELCVKYPVTSGESLACTLVKDIEFSP